MKTNRYSNFPAEIKQVKAYLSDHTATATMTAVALDIYRPNLSRHKRTLEMSGQLVEVYKGICKETGFKAFYLTTNPDLIAKIKAERRSPDGN